MRSSDAQTSLSPFRTIPGSGASCPRETRRTQEAIAKALSTSGRGSSCSTFPTRTLPGVSRWRARSLKVCRPGVPVQWATVLPDDRVLCLYRDGRPFLWSPNAPSWSTQVLPDSLERLRPLSALPDRYTVCFETEAHSIRIWDGRLTQWRSVLAGHTGPVLGVLDLSFERLLSWSEDKTLRVWNIDTGDCLAVLRGHTGVVSGAAVLSDGRLLSWSTDATLRVWHPATASSVLTLTGHLAAVTIGVPLQPDLVLSGSNDRSLRQWALASPISAEHPDWHATPLTGGLALPGEGDLLVRRWSREALDGATGACLRSFVGPSAPIDGAFPVAGDRLVTWAQDHVIRLWRVDDGSCSALLSGHEGRILGVLLLPSGGLLSWSADHTARVWDLDRSLCQAVLSGHQGPLTGALPLSARLALTWAEDRTLAVWDTSSGVCLERLNAGQRSVLGTLVLPGERFLSWSGEQDLRLWEPTVPGSGWRATVVALAHDVSAVLPLGNGRYVTNNLSILEERRTFLDRKTEQDLSLLWSSAQSPTRQRHRGVPRMSGATPDRFGVTLKVVRRLGAVWSRNSPVRRVFVLPGRRVMSRSFYGETRFWDTSTGGCFGSVADVTAYERGFAQAAAVGDRAVVVGNRAGGVRVLVLPADNETAMRAGPEWHSDDAARILSHECDEGAGIYVAATRGVRVLHLYSGGAHCSLTAEHSCLVEGA